MASISVMLRGMTAEEINKLYLASMKIEGDYNDLVSQIVKDWLLREQRA
jgi:hypothetical protein